MERALNPISRTLTNKSKYITKDTLNQCFDLGYTNHVDKVICGNGFSTAFLNTTPPRGKINIIIAPNKAVVIAKEGAYIIAQEFKTESLNRQKFFYAEGNSKELNNADVLVFVADSFLRYKKQINRIKDKINWVLIDEVHSVEIQSSFRKNLLDFTNKVSKIIGQKPALTTVTATPLLFSKCNIHIKNSEVKPIKIYASNDYENAINRIKKLIKQRENVLVATNSSNVIYRLRDSDNVIEGDFNIGKSLMSSIVEVGIIKHNDRSNLKIISSRGFEGFDIYGEDYNIFFFEDRSSDVETFYISNLYQALNRCRDGYKRIDYIRLELSNRRKEPIKNVEKNIKRFINRKDLSTEQKQSNKYKEYHKFLIFDKNNDSHNFTLRINESAIRLHKEVFLYDNFFNTDVFNEFLNDRNITIEECFDIQNRLPRKNVNEKTIKKNLLENSELIKSRDLFGYDYVLNINSYDKRKDALKHVKRFLRRKNYDGLYEQNNREDLAINLLKDDVLFNKCFKKIIKINNEYHLKKYSKRKAKKRIDDFTCSATNTFLNLIQMFINKNPFAPKKIVGHRDYNLLTSASTDVIEYVGGLFGFEVIEYDIRNCFPRILYALCGLELPIDFYGVDKINKVGINIYLNDFMLDTKKDSSFKEQKRLAINKFKELGFNELVIEFLMSGFFNSKFRGDLFNYLSFYESVIIKELQNKILKPNEISNIRRHDSVLLFIEYNDNEKYNVNGVLNSVINFEFLGQKNWFIDSNEFSNFEACRLSIEDEKVLV